MVLLISAGIALWGMDLLDGRVAAAIPLAWFLIGFLATPSIIYEHLGFLDRHIFHDYSKARARYRKAVDTKKATPDGMAALASLCYSEGDATEAARLLDEARAKRPGDPYIHAMLSRVLSNLGRHDEALAIATGLQQVRKSDQGQLSDLTLAVVLKAKGETVGAASAYQKVADTAPHLAEPRIALTELYLGMGQPEAAGREAEQALNISPSNPDALYWAGKATEARGDRAEAGKYYRSALESRAVGERAYSVSYKDMVKAVSTASEATPLSLGQDVRKP